VTENVLQTPEPSQVLEGLKARVHGKALINDSPDRFRITP
jgi:hypothetical protein